jgi:uncharacterized membrane protein
MSRLIAISYPDVATAEQVRQELVEASREHLVELQDAVVVEHEPGGKIKLRQVRNTTAGGAAGGVLWGGLIGLLFLAPLLGMALGAAGGALAGKMTDLGVADDFMTTLGANLQPGTAALIVLGSTQSRDKLIQRVSPYGGTILQSSLSTEAEQQLQDALDSAAGAPA